MVSVTKVIEWDMGHRVPNHKHKCANPHGHRYRLELTVSGLVSEEKGSSSEGMVVDFSEIKQAMMDRIHDPLDHCFMAYEDDPMAQLLVRNLAKNTCQAPFSTVLDACITLFSPCLLASVTHTLARRGICRFYCPSVL